MTIWNQRGRPVGQSIQIKGQVSKQRSNGTKNRKNRASLEGNAAQIIPFSLSACIVDIYSLILMWSTDFHSSLQKAKSCPLVPGPAVLRQSQKTVTAKKMEYNRSCAK